MWNGNLYIEIDEIPIVYPGLETHKVFAWARIYSKVNTSFDLKKFPPEDGILNIQIYLYGDNGGKLTLSKSVYPWGYTEGVKVNLPSEIKANMEMISALFRKHFQ